MAAEHHGDTGGMNQVDASLKQNGEIVRATISDPDMTRRLQNIQDMQRDCVTCVRHLEGNLGGMLSEGAFGTSRTNGELFPVPEPSGVKTEEQVDAFQRCLESNMLFMETVMRELLHRQVRREVVSCQTESTSINARDVAAQTTDSILGELHSDKIMFSLPDLDEEIANLRIDMETQTDLQLEHFARDNAKLNKNDNVIIIYRNPSMSSFMKPYLTAVGGTALGCFVIYKTVKFFVSFKPQPSVITS